MIELLKNTILIYFSFIMIASLGSLFLCLEGNKDIEYMCPNILVHYLSILVKFDSFKQIQMIYSNLFKQMPITIVQYTIISAYLTLVSLLFALLYKFLGIITHILKIITVFCVIGALFHHFFQGKEDGIIKFILKYLH